MGLAESETLHNPHHVTSIAGGHLLLLSILTFYIWLQAMPLFCPASHPLTL